MGLEVISSLRILKFKICNGFDKLRACLKEEFE